MHNIFYITDVIYQINHFLTLKEKCKFRLSNKFLSDISKNIVFLHMGDILARKIGIDNAEQDSIILRDIPLEIIREIIDLLEIPYTMKLKINKPINTIPLGLILRIFRTNRNDCIKKLKTKMMFRVIDIKSKYTTNTKTFRKYFPNCYALID